jgi:hypothetical protein
MQQNQVVSYGLIKSNEAQEAYHCLISLCQTSRCHSGWAKNVKSAVLHVVFLAQVAIIDARGLAAKGSGPSPWIPPACQYRIAFPI